MMESPYENIGGTEYHTQLFGFRSSMTITGIFTASSRVIFEYDSRDLRAFVDRVQSHLVWTD